VSGGLDLTGRGARSARTRCVRIGVPGIAERGAVGYGDSGSVDVQEAVGSMRQYIAGARARCSSIAGACWRRPSFSTPFRVSLSACRCYPTPSTYCLLRCCVTPLHACDLAHL